MFPEEMETIHDYLRGHRLESLRPETGPLQVTNKADAESPSEGYPRGFGRVKGNDGMASQSLAHEFMMGTMDIENLLRNALRGFEHVWQGSSGGAKQVGRDT